MGPEYIKLWKCKDDKMVDRRVQGEGKEEV